MRIVELEEGDLLVLRTCARVGPRQMEEYRELRRLLPDGCHIMVLPYEMKLEVWRPSTQEHT